MTLDEKGRKHYILIIRHHFELQIFIQYKRSESQRRTLKVQLRALVI